MVEANEDALSVTMKIRSETRAAKLRAEAERAAAGADELRAPSPAQPAVGHGRLDASAEAHVSVPPPAQSHRPVDADTAFRRARLGFVAALALVLLLVWIMQRRR